VNVASTNDKLGKCLNFLRLMHQRRLVTQRPKAHAWHSVNVETCLAVNADGSGFSFRIFVVEVNRKTGRQSREDCVYEASGPTAEGLVASALKVLETAISAYVEHNSKSVPKSTDGDELYVEHADGHVEPVTIPRGAWAVTGFLGLSTEWDGWN